MRLPAEQTSPWLMKTPNSAPSTAASQSASAKKIFGDLPPSSSVTRFSVSAALFTIILPTAALPVNATLSTPGWATSAAPAVSPKPLIIFTTGCHIGDVVFRLNDGLAGVTRFEFGQTCRVLSNFLREFKQDASAVLRSRFRPGAAIK